MIFIDLSFIFGKNEENHSKQIWCIMEQTSNINKKCMLTTTTFQIIFSKLIHNK